MDLPTLAQDLADLAPRGSEGHDGDDGDECEDEGVFGETLAVLVALDEGQGPEVQDPVMTPLSWEFARLDGTSLPCQKG